MLTSGLSSSERQIVLVCGSKGVGKSSFAKLVSNTLLNSVQRISFMDTDLGQPEFTPPGETELVPFPPSLSNQIMWYCCWALPALLALLCSATQVVLPSVMVKRG